MKFSIGVPSAIRNSKDCCLSNLCVTLWHMSISSGIVIAVALQEVDDTPNAETGTECDYEGLKNGDCLSKKCHK